jgi:hypothetical protein
MSSPSTPPSASSPHAPVRTVAEVQHDLDRKREHVSLKSYWGTSFDEDCDANSGLASTRNHYHVTATPRELARRPAWPPTLCRLRAANAADTHVQEADRGVEGGAGGGESAFRFGGAADLGREAFAMGHRESIGLQIFQFVNYCY